MDNYKILFTVLLITVQLSECVNHCIDKKSNKEEQLCQAVQISCPPGHVLYKPNITASDKPCGQSPSCSDLPVDLMVDVSECYWKQSCIINFPQTPFLKCGKPVKSLHVHNWQCINLSEQPKTYLGLICNGTTDLGSGVTQGLIRSHTEIPWLYERGTFTKNSNGIQCNKTIHLEVESRDRYIVSALFVDVDGDNDKLTINGEVIQSVTDGPKIFTGSDKKIVFIFTSGPGVTKGGSGFVICFKKLNPEDKDTDACDGIITSVNEPVQNATSTDMDCRSKRQKPQTLQQDEDETSICEKIMTLYKRTTSLSNITTQSPVTPSPACAKCLSRKRIGSKCKRTCCKVPSKPRDCSKPIKKRKKNKARKCKLKERRLNQRCEKCAKAKKCKSEFKKRCRACCSGRKDNLKKCNRRKKGQKKRRKSEDGRRKKSKSG